jgi:hypothetical protein
LVLVHFFWISKIVSTFSADSLSSGFVVSFPLSIGDVSLISLIPISLKKWVYPNLSNELVSRITTFIRKLLVSPLGEWKIKIDRIPF